MAVMKSRCRIVTWHCAFITCPSRCTIHTASGIALVGVIGSRSEVTAPGPSNVPESHAARVNVGCGPAEERVLLTGLHAVADIYCENCKTTLGWKYEHAFESSQKYKEGKFIIELAHMIKDNGW
uniref:Protein yippee-like n=1 Tax=Rattus norvegicus TaxID=10116 RepID=A0ABK0LM88_RAT